MNATPAERLTAAADLLDKLAGEAMPGPWAVAGRDGVWERPIVMETLTDNGEDEEEEEPKNYVVAEMRHGYTWEADAAYIATMHPEVGKALANVLRAEAQRVHRGQGHAFGGGDMYPARPDMVALADLILGGAA